MAACVTTGDAALAHEIRLLRNHGAEPKYFHQRVGGNFRLDALQAAVLRVKLPHLAAMDGARAGECGALRSRSLPSAGLTGRMTLPVDLRSDHIFNQYVIRVTDRDRVRDRLQDAGIGTEIYYPVPFHLQECFASLGYRRVPFLTPNGPHAKRWRCPSIRSSPKRSSRAWWWRSQRRWPEYADSRDRCRRSARDCDC